MIALCQQWSLYNGVFIIVSFCYRSETETQRGHESKFVWLEKLSSFYCNVWSCAHRALSPEFRQVAWLFYIGLGSKYSHYLIPVLPTGFDSGRFYVLIPVRPPFPTDHEHSFQAEEISYPVSRVDIKPSYGSPLQYRRLTSVTSRQHPGCCQADIWVLARASWQRRKTGVWLHKTCIFHSNLCPSLDLSYEKEE